MLELLRREFQHGLPKKLQVERKKSDKSSFFVAGSRRIRDGVPTFSQ
jgi:hypothetical protein